MTFVLVPQAVRRMLPVLIAQLVVLLKDSSLGFIVGYLELLRTARSLVETLNFQFGPIYTFQLYVAAGLIYIVVNVLLSQLAKYVEGRTRRNKKAAATAEVALPADMQMGGGGGAAPPGSDRFPARRGRGDDPPLRGEDDRHHGDEDAVVRRPLPAGRPAPGTRRRPGRPPPSSSSPGCGRARRDSPPPRVRCRRSSPRSSLRPAIDGPGAAWCCAIPVERRPTPRSSGPPARPRSPPANGSPARSAAGWRPVGSREAPWLVADAAAPGGQAVDVCAWAAAG